MSNKRVITQEFILNSLNSLVTDGSARRIYEKFVFADMSDADFDAYIDKLESGEEFLVVFQPNMAPDNISVRNNLKVAEQLGHNFFQRIWKSGAKDGVEDHLTPIPYMVVDLPVRRASQLLSKKISVPDDGKVVDALTGQVTGPSKGAKISYPELMISVATGAEACMVELMKYCGGDIRGNVAYEGLLSQQGEVDLNVLSNFASGVESTNTLKAMLTSALLANSL